MVTPFEQMPAVVERVQRELVLARFLGKIAVDQGLAELRSQIESAIFPRVPDNDVPVRERPAADATSPDTTTAPGDSPAVSPVDAEELALADYDHLPASDIVAKLGGLEPEELDAIERYELARRHRRTVLGKIGQLRAS